MDTEEQSCGLIIADLVREQKSYLKQIELKMDLYGGLAYDSISMIQLLLKIEKRFQIRFRGTDVTRQNLRTLHDLVHLVLERRGKK